MLDRNTLGELALSVISSAFPGGIEGLIRAHGYISIADFEEDTVLIYLKPVPEEFKAVIDRINHSDKFRIKIVDTINFDNLSMHEVAEQISEVGLDIEAKYGIEMLYNPLDPLVLRVLIPVKELAEEVVEDISSIFITRIPTLIRGAITVGNRIYRFSRPDTVETKPTTPPPAQITTDRAPITPEVITDLKIALSEECDVLDFISKL